MTYNNDYMTYVDYVLKVEELKARLSIDNDKVVEGVKLVYVGGLKNVSDHESYSEDGLMYWEDHEEIRCFYTKEGHLSMVAFND